jgi:hypothetical protein
VLQGKAPAWPGPNFATSDYVGSKGVTIVGLDSPSIGAFGDPDYTFEDRKATAVRPARRSRAISACSSTAGSTSRG